MTSLSLECELEPSVQLPDDLSFIGGKPNISPDMSIPICGLCQQEQTFFFQVMFPSGTQWPDRGLAVFACTKCANEQFLIPELLPAHEDIPLGFLEKYQVNFRFCPLVPQNCTVRQSYFEKIRFSRWRTSPVDDDFEGTKIGGNPVWILGDESPGLYDSRIGMVFLMQLDENHIFVTLPGSPRQMTISSRVPSGMMPADHDYYELFVGNALYLFGTSDWEQYVLGIVQGN